MCFLGGRWRISEGFAPSPSIAGRGTYSLAFTSCTQLQCNQLCCSRCEAQIAIHRPSQ